MAKRTPKPFEIPYDDILKITTDKTTKRGGVTVIVTPKTYLGTTLSNKFQDCYKECIRALSATTRIPLISAVAGKTYFAFSLVNNDHSRPVNQVLYDDADTVIGTDSLGNPLTKVDQFFVNLKASNINAQSAQDITSSLYKIVMSFACCTDLFSGSGRKQVGTFFEKLVGHLYSTHFNLEPELTLFTNTLDGKSTSIPADYVYNTGIDKAKFHIPAKFSSRDRSVQVWAQQRLIDGAFGVGRFHCLLTCCNETDYNKNQVTEVLVGGQWMNYQLYIAQILRAYYLDLPDGYKNLSSAYPPIHAKTFGEFFHESSSLV
jgi:hypothetical protein